ncbi:MAG TPA: hypothetical protein VIG29_07285, partial [Vicinamibacteria bacterium]
HVRDYASRVKHELLTELRASAGELTDALSALDPDTWSRDYGVRHKGQVVTVKSTVEDLIVDYVHHGEQVRALAR